MIWISLFVQSLTVYTLGGIRDFFLISSIVFIFDLCLVKALRIVRVFLILRSKVPMPVVRENIPHRNSHKAMRIETVIRKHFCVALFLNFSVSSRRSFSVANGSREFLDAFATRCYAFKKFCCSHWHRSRAHPRRTREVADSTPFKRQIRSRRAHTDVSISSIDVMTGWVLLAQLTASY